MNKFIETKLQKPEIPLDFIVKKNIISMLNKKTMILFYAKAGTGKSTVVSHWLDNQDQPFVWLILDAWDNNRSAFVENLTFCVQKVSPSIGNQIMQFANLSANMDDLSYVKAIISSLHEIEDQWTLVLDDFHLIDNPFINKLIFMLIKHKPKNLKLIIISRNKPVFEISKLQIQNKISVVRDEDLQFSIDDVKSLIDKNPSLKEYNVNAELLLKVSEGWITGLTLIMNNIKGKTDINSIRNNTNDISEYLLEEVISKQSDQMRSFLKQSALLDYFTVEMCSEVLGLDINFVSESIDYLVDTNCFLTTTMIDKKWYRYHHLFSEFLRTKIKKTNPKLTNKIYISLAKWFKKQNQLKQAATCFINAKQHDLAADLIEPLWYPMDQKLQSSSWLEMVKRLPQSVIERRPVLCIGYAWALIDKGCFEESEPWLLKAKSISKMSSKDIVVRDLDTFEQINMHIVSARAYIAASNNQFEDLLKYKTILHQNNDGSKIKNSWLLDTFEATLYWGQGDITSAYKCFTKVVNNNYGNFAPIVYVSFKFIIVELLIQFGELKRAENILNNIIEMIEKNKLVPTLLAQSKLYIASIAMIRNERNYAFEALEKSFKYGHKYEYMNWRYKYYNLKARLFIEDGLYSNAFEQIECARQNIFLNPIPETFTVDDLQFWAELEVDRSKKYINNQLEKELKQLTEDYTILPEYTKETKLKIMLYILPVDNKNDKIRFICKELIKRAKSQGRLLDEIDWTVILSNYQSNEHKRQSILKKAHELADKEKIEQPFHFIKREYKSDLVKKSVKGIEKILVNNSLAHPLTTRELEILELLAKGYTNKHISDTIFIAISTVKSYNHELFSKLEVNNRTSAVIKAKEIGLI